MNDKQRPKGMNQRGGKYYLEFKQIKHAEIGRNNVMLFFLINTMGMNECRMMLQSGRKQRDFCIAVMAQLKEYQVQQKYEKTFDEDVKMLHKRSEHVKKIISENIRLTELWPYFSAIGFQRLEDFASGYSKINNEQDAASQLKADIEEWNAEHQEEIKRHMESVAEEIRIRDEHRAKVKAEAKAEKEARKLIENARKKFEKESQKIAHDREVRERKLEREFARYYR